MRSMSTVTCPHHHPPADDAKRSVQPIPTDSLASSQVVEGVEISTSLEVGVEDQPADIEGLPRPRPPLLKQSVDHAIPHAHDRLGGDSTSRDTSLVAISPPPDGPHASLPSKQLPTLSGLSEATEPPSELVETPKLQHTAPDLPLHGGASDHPDNSTPSAWPADALKTPDTPHGEQQHGTQPASDLSSLTEHGVESEGAGASPAPYTRSSLLPAAAQHAACKDEGQQQQGQLGDPPIEQETDAGNESHVVHGSAETAKPEAEEVVEVVIRGQDSVTLLSSVEDDSFDDVRPPCWQW